LHFLFSHIRNQQVDRFNLLKNCLILGFKRAKKLDFAVKYFASLNIFVVVPVEFSNFVDLRLMNLRYVLLKKVSPLDLILTVHAELLLEHQQDISPELLHLVQKLLVPFA